MITFLVSIILLIIGYFVYGKFIDKFFGSSDKIVTPVRRMADGVDYQEIKPWRIFVIQFLNIAGLGPIFGAIMGAYYGPMAYVWIVLGCVFMGAVHDYFSGMLSIRNDGMSLPGIVGKYLGKNMRYFMTVLTIFLLLAVGVAFVNGPAQLLQELTHLNMRIWLYIIFAYYIMATLLPVDKIIGKVYPFMGGALLFMAIGVGVAMIFNFTGNIHITELSLDSFRNMHSNSADNILYPMLFIVISCGAISGFHATQSPMMARCLGNEKYGRPIYYGAMIAEGIVAMIWATAAIAYCGGVEGLNASGKSPAILVNEICNSWLGQVGAIIAVVGVVICPITSGDTAFRSMRLILADGLKYNQKKIYNRLLLSLPIFIVAYFLSQFDFSMIWKYVGITNQILATITLWTISSYLVKKHKFHWLSTFPAIFLTCVCATYFMIAPNNVGGFHLAHGLSYIIGLGVGILAFILFYENIILPENKIKNESKN